MSIVFMPSVPSMAELKAIGTELLRKLYTDTTEQLKQPVMGSERVVLRRSMKRYEAELVNRNLLTTV